MFPIYLSQAQVGQRKIVVAVVTRSGISSDGHVTASEFMGQAGRAPA